MPIDDLVVSWPPAPAHRRHTINSTRIPLMVLIAACVAYAVYVNSTLAGLPAHVASHFGANGQPNGWMSHAQYAKFTILFGLGMALFPQLIGLLIGSIPTSLINVPNRDYWFAEVRRSATVAWLRGHMAWLGCLMLVFMTTIHASIVRANLPGAGKLATSEVGPIIGGFVAGILVWSIVMLVHFRKPKSQGQVYVSGKPAV
jgi:hypothetical protein